MKVSIGHLTFTVRWATAVEEAASPGLYGLCMMSAGEIIIHPSNQSVPEMASTLMHEIMHAMWHAYVLPDRITEEVACRKLEGPLVAFYADNPQVVAAMIAARCGTPLPIQ